PDGSGVSAAVLLRRIEGLAGTMEIEIEFAPRFAYGRTAPRLSRTPAGILASGAGEGLLLSGVELAIDEGAHAFARLQVQAGERIDLVLRHEPFERAAPFSYALGASPSEIEARTLARWRTWSSSTRVPPNADAPL